MNHFGGYVVVHHNASRSTFDKIILIFQEIFHVCRSWMTTRWITMPLLSFCYSCSIINMVFPFFFVSGKELTPIVVIIILSKICLIKYNTGSVAYEGLFGDVVILQCQGRIAHTCRNALSHRRTMCLTHIFFKFVPVDVRYWTYDKARRRSLFI